MEEYVHLQRRPTADATASDFPQSAMRLAIAVIVLLLIVMPQCKYAALHSAFYDLGQYSTLLYAAARSGDAAQLLQGHAHIAAIPYIWLYGALPSPAILLLTQSLILSATAILAGRVWETANAGSEIEGALIYLLSISVWFNALFDFHFEHLVFPIYFTAALAAQRRDPTSVAVLIAAAAALGMVKEVYPLIVAGLGAHLAISQRRYVLGAGLAAMGLAAFLITTQRIIPHYMGGAQAVSLWQNAFGHLGLSTSDVLVSIAHQPLALVSDILEPRKIMYVLVLLGSYAFVCLREPTLLLPAAPILAILLISHNPSHTYLGNQYTAGISAPLFVAAAAAMGKLSDEFRRRLTKSILASAVLALFLFGPSPVSRLFLQNSTWSYGATAYAPSARDRLINNLLTEVVPGDETAIVSTQNTLITSGLVARYTLFAFPVAVFKPVPVLVAKPRSMFAAVMAGLLLAAPAEQVDVIAGWVVLDRTRAEFLGDQGCEWRAGSCTDTSFGPRYEAALNLLAAQFDLIFDREGVQVWRRKR